jgi:acyl-CoA oxidase
LGTSRHEALIEKCSNYEISGCFCMTEMSHGSNTRELKTTATYDPETQVCTRLKKLFFPLKKVT